MNEIVDRVGKAIDAVQVWSRFNDWTSDRVGGLPIEICRWAGDAKTTDDLEIIKRFPASKGEDAALREVVSEMRARAAIEAMREPTEAMLFAADWLENGTLDAWRAMIDAALATPEE